MNKRHRGVHSGQFAWCSLAQACLAYRYNDLKQMFAGGDYVPLRYTAFDVRGTRSWLVAAIHCNRQSLFVRRVLTHAEYDLWTRKNLIS
ncbi:type II toxin-antitoxin system HigB family toxin [Paraburkholderia panacisoli]|uniref:Type II toxin-antitoxin system HigB family toxin n=2 Tax=Paraburkholderia panacisoli TaxID=2603818 RepID=A0A5B0GB73_9BURK|nr:type II toxin-antitoxin system HigB family toxin [Paraburkholderia panacisoli]